MKKRISWFLMACACVAVPTFAESNPDKSEPAEKKVRLLLPSILMCIPVSAMRMMTGDLDWTARIWVINTTCLTVCR